MISKPDPGVIVAIVSGVAVIAAIVAGLVTVGGPGEARDQRFDDVRYQAIGEIATVARCYYDENGALPATIEDARDYSAGIAFSERTCARVTLRPDPEGTISYSVAGPAQLNLCAQFRRPSPSPDRRPVSVYAESFPELAAPRTELGHRCYLIQVRPL